MRKGSRATQGVTLLEVMLVLAIAAMIIVMSVRYYQSASRNQQTNSFLQQLQGITATVESLALGGGTYSSISATSLKNMLPGGASALVAPWGGAMTFTAQSNGFKLSLTVAPSVTACTIITAQLKANNHYTIDSTCKTVTYITNP